MKYIYFYISAIFLKILDFVDSFIPFIEKYIPQNTRDIVKSLSGLLQNINPYSNNIKKPTDKICDIQSEIIIPGFMEHNPKAEALRLFKRKKRQTL